MKDQTDHPGPRFLTKPFPTKVLGEDDIYLNERPDVAISSQLISNYASGLQTICTKVRSML